METFHKIDPSGDTLLILHNANAPFAVLPSPNPPADQNASASTSDDTPAGQPQDTDAKPTVRMQLSSKHLALASAYFQRLTAGGWKENTPEGCYSCVITAHDWDEQALIVLMNIIHGRTAAVPREVDLEMLAKIATLVDYYQCHEAVDFFAKTWLTAESLRQVVTSGQRQFMLRLLVCLVFSEATYFTSLTRSIIRNHMGPIDPLGLPIQHNILDELDEQRENIISGVVSELYALQKRLARLDTCTTKCSSTHLGALVKGMMDLGVTDPRPAPPYFDLSVNLLERGISSIKDASGESTRTGLPATPAAPAKHKSGGYHGSRHGSHGRKPAANPSCALTARTQGILQNQITAKLSGLMLPGSTIKADHIPFFGLYARQ
ncbi:hypothetical protein V8C35DRAFT_156749 [Trichoderma chlorosporum]